MSSTTPTESATASTRKRSRVRTFFVRVAFVSAVLATVVAAWYAIERLRGRVLWESYERQARSAGTKMTYDQIVPPSVPDAENFAAIPLFEEAFRAQAEQREIPRPFDWPKGGKEKAPGTGDAALGVSLDLKAWQSFFVTFGLIPSASDNPAADVLAALKKYDPELEQLRIAGQRPSCRFPVKWEDGAATPLPHLALLNAPTRIYVLRLGAHLSLGDNEGAYRDFQEALRIYTATKREPNLITALVRSTIPPALEGAVWDGLARRQWKPADLVRIEQDLQAVNSFADYQLGMESERCFSNLLYPQLRAMSAAKMVELVTMVEPLQTTDGANFVWQKRYLSLYPRGWIYRSQERANRYVDDLLGRVSLDPPRLYPERATVSAPENLHGTYERWRHYFFALSAPVFQNMELRFARLQALTDHTRLACALERFRQEKSTYPAQLVELAPEFIAVVPSDVMNGQPYRYRRDDDGSYLLYSLASNLADDGGERGPSIAPAKSLDWVWKMPAASAVAK